MKRKKNETLAMKCKHKAFFLFLIDFINKMYRQFYL